MAFNESKFAALAETMMFALRNHLRPEFVSGRDGKVDLSDSLYRRS